MAVVFTKTTEYIEENRLARGKVVILFQNVDEVELNQFLISLGEFVEGKRKAMKDGNVPEQTQKSTSVTTKIPPIELMSSGSGTSSAETKIPEQTPVKQRKEKKPRTFMNHPGSDAYSASPRIHPRQFQFIKETDDLDVLLKTFRVKYVNSEFVKDEMLTYHWKKYHPSAEISPLGSSKCKFKANDRVTQVKGPFPYVGVGTVMTAREDKVVTVRFIGGIKCLYEDHFEFAIPEKKEK